MYGLSIHVRLGECRDPKFLLENLGEGGLGIDGKIILKLELKKLCSR
jgi:hypothetical protein